MPQHHAWGRKERHPSWCPPGGAVRAPSPRQGPPAHLEPYGPAVVVAQGAHARHPVALQPVLEGGVVVRVVWVKEVFLWEGGEEKGQRNRAGEGALSCRSPAQALPAVPVPQLPASQPHPPPRPPWALCGTAPGDPGYPASASASYSASGKNSAGVEKGSHLPATSASLGGGSLHPPNPHLPSPP